MAPNKLSGLKYAGPVQVKEVKTGEKGEVLEVFVELLKDCKEKPKSFLHWISEKDAVECEVRLYDYLFLQDEPAKAEGEWEQKINKNSLIVKKGVKMNRNLIGAKHLDRY